MKLLQRRIVGSAQQLIKDVKVPFVVVLMDDARLLQQVVQDVAAIRNSLPVDKRNVIVRFLITRDKGAYQLKLMSIYFPKRDELLLRFVLALPKASRIGFVDTSLSFTDSMLSM